MHSWLDDLRYAFRALRKNPILSTVALLSLAIGIGANTAIFSLMDRMLFRSLPVRDPRALVLMRSAGGWSGAVETEYGDAVSFSWPKYRALAGQTGAVFEGILARFPFAASIASKSWTEAARGEMVSGNYFDLLGIRPALGRLLADDDARTRGANPVAVLSYGYWNRRFGGDPGILNQSLTVNGKPLTVVGVTQAGFASVGAGETPELFVPVTMASEMTPSWAAGNAFDNPHAYWLNLFGRLRPGVSREQARAAVAVVWHGILASDAPQLSAGAGREKYLAKTMELRDGGNGISAIRADFELPLYLLMGMVGLVLLIACANVANLLLARAMARGRETAIRIALGAGRGRLIRHILAESLILSIMGGALGLLVASWAGQFMLRMVPGDMPVAGIAVETDGRVLVFTCAVSILTGLLFGCAPALRVTRPDLTPVLKQGAQAPGGHARLRQVLVAGQIAVSALLLASAGLFAHSLHNLRTLNPGFRAGGLYSAGLNPRLLGYPAERSRRLFADLQRELSASPGVGGVSMAKWSLVTGSFNIHGFTVEGFRTPDGAPSTFSDNHVGAGFFSVMGIPLLAGREFRESDAANGPLVAVVNETLARKFFAGRNPLGMHLTWRRAGISYEIVGVVKDAKYDDLRELPKPFVYLAAAQDPDPGPMTLYVRSQLAGDAVGASVRRIARRLDPSLPVSGPQTVEQQILNSVFVDRMVAALASMFAMLATALAAIGLYGVVAWAVSRRRREIGIRMALGAEPVAVMRMVLGEVLRMGAWGMAIAVPLWALSGRLLRTLLFGVTDRDPLTLALALAVVITVTVAAGFIPAWRASRIDPNSAIRQDG